MKQYLDLLKDIRTNGVYKQDRTGTGTFSVFGRQMRFNLQDGFPLLTTKKLHIKSILHELFWFLNGDTNVKYLKDNGVSIWDDWRRPYSLNRPIILVKKKTAEHQPYDGDFSLKGFLSKGRGTDADLIQLWLRMMKRCYDPSHEKYRFYGKVGVSVAKQWHDPAHFVDSVKKIPQWSQKLRDWARFDLDKDYFGSKQYGPDTCVWLRGDENRMYMSSATPLLVTDTSGRDYTFVCASSAARSLGISTSSVNRFVKAGRVIGSKGANKKIEGFLFNRLKGDDLVRLELIDDGDLGPIYGKQWRNWAGEDQISNLISRLKTHPDCRRLIVSAWNVAELKDMALMPCHCLFQFYTSPATPDESEKNRIAGMEPPKLRLSCQLYQRSGDTLLGIPYNIASYAFLLSMVAQCVNMVPYEFVWTGGDTHLYSNHIEQADLQLTREPRALPKLVLNPVRDIFGYRFEDFKIIGYDPHPSIKAPIAV